MHQITRVRRRIDRLSSGEQQRLRVAFRTLINSNDPGGNLRYWASIHRACCPHRSELFLPWHRAYIFAFEEALRRTAGGMDVTLPYWDWTVVREIPEIVRHEPLDSDRYEQQNPDKLPSSHEIEGMLRDADFKRFGGSGCRLPCRGGCLEDRHGVVHTWVGPVMEHPATAALDPLFWFHHAYVDHVWKRWQDRHDRNPSCVDAPLQGIPGDWTVGDVLDINGGRLGYAYDDSVVLHGPFTFDSERVHLSMDVPSDAFTFRAGIRLDNVLIVGEGRPPIELEVRAGEEPGDLIARLSLFGVHSHHTLGDGHKCQHLNGSFMTCLTPPTSGPATPVRLKLMARWAPAHPRAGITVGAVAFGDV